MVFSFPRGSARSARGAEYANAAAAQRSAVSALFFLFQEVFSRGSLLGSDWPSIRNRYRVTWTSGVSRRRRGSASELTADEP
jgi:hypothetical protein